MKNGILNYENRSDRHYNFDFDAYRFVNKKVAIEMMVKNGILDSEKRN